jgi:hypothetical protein
MAKVPAASKTAMGVPGLTSISKVPRNNKAKTW